MPNASPRPPRRAALPLARVLGLKGHGDTRAIGELRAAAMRARRPVWLATHAVAALAVLALRFGTQPIATLLPWSALVIGLAALVAVATRRRTAEDRTPRYRIDALGGIALGIAWAVAPMLFGEHGAPGAPLRTLLVCLLAVSTVLAAPVPLVGLCFMALVGAGLVATVLSEGAPLLAAVLALVTLAGIASLLLNTRTLLRRIIAEQALDEKEEVVSLLLREFEEQGSDWLWQIDASRRLVDVSARMAGQFGRSPERIEGRPLLELIAGEGWEQGRVARPVRDLADRLMRRESFRDLIVPITIDGEQRWWSLSATPRRDGRGALSGFLGVGSDVTEQHRSAEKIDRMARFDALTGLANRAHIIDSLGKALRDGHHAGTRSTLMLIDLDRFKQVNDTLGHPIGDKLLVAVSGRLRGLAIKGDVCGRLGGDEFAVVVADATDRDRVETLAETIVSALSAPYEIDGHRLHIGASVGSATSPRDGRVMETLLRNADLALYRAKDDGRGVHRRYEPELHAAAEERRQIEGALREAIERGELRLAYQPIVDIADGGISGFEALLRWTHPTMGAIAPDVFLPIAEEARLIGRIGDWVMHTACRDAANWPPHIRVSVNLAAVQIKDPQLPATIVSALSHSGIAGDRLEFEIAEQVFLKGGAAVTAAVDRLLSLGVGMSLCDYGSGQAAGFLRKGRFSSVKIDRDFVRGVAAAVPESIAIVRAIVAMADSLGMVTIAEGAESSADFDRMQKLGCARIQGWTISQPLDAVAALAMADGSVAGLESGRQVA